VLGAASGNANISGLKQATQNSVTTTPTQTIFTLTAGPVNVVVTFLSPVEYNDLKRQSIPLSYMLISVASNDGNSHSVQVYSDISGEWASNDVTQTIQWAVTSDGSVNIWTSQLQTQTQFAENSDYPTWGQAVLAASTSATYASGEDITVRNSFISSGSLGNTNDGNFRCVQCNWPVFAFSYNVGIVTSTASTPVEFVIGKYFLYNDTMYAMFSDLERSLLTGHVRPQNIQFLGSEMNAYWQNYWTNANDMINFFYGDLSNAQTTANSVDSQILTGRHSP
jgi:hypothetical protein